MTCLPIPTWAPQSGEGGIDGSHGFRGTACGPAWDSVGGLGRRASTSGLWIPASECVQGLDGRWGQGLQTPRRLGGGATSGPVSWEPGPAPRFLRWVCPTSCGRAEGSWRQKAVPALPARQSLLVCATVNLLGRGRSPSTMCEVQVSSSAQRLGPGWAGSWRGALSWSLFCAIQCQLPSRLPAWMDGPHGPQPQPCVLQHRGELCPSERVTPRRRPTGLPGPRDPCRRAACGSSPHPGTSGPGARQATTARTRGKGVADTSASHCREQEVGDQLGQGLLPGLRKARCLQG